MKKVNPKCPNCERSLKAFEPMQQATQVIDRKCQGCGAKWRVVVKNDKINGIGIRSEMNFKEVTK